MFTQEEVKTFLIKYGKNWFFPDFTNKLTWFVASLGGTILLTPTVLKEVLINWLINTLNLNSGELVTLAELESSNTDAIIGFGLIFLALAYNLSNKYLNYISIVKPAQIAKQAQVETDKVLFASFLKDFPSNGASLELLRDHDFYSGFHHNSVDKLDEFVGTWNTAEMEFLDEDIEMKRKELHTNCAVFNHKLALKAHYINGGPILSCVPDGFRGAFTLPEHVEKPIDELNKLSRQCYELHQEFIKFVRGTLKC